MKKNKDIFLEKLMENTNKSEEDCRKINEIVNSHFIIGKNNKIKMMNDFMKQLNVSEEEADDLYNICIELILKGIFHKN